MRTCPGGRPHFKRHFECYPPIKDGAHSSTVGAASVDVEARRQQDTVFYRDRAVREGGDEELVPAWVQKKRRKHEHSVPLSLPPPVCVNHV